MNTKFNIFLFFSLVLLSSFILCLPRKLTIWMIGDSTMSVKAASAYPETGWGMPFGNFFKPGVVVQDKAMNGRSTQSFITENRWRDVYENLKSGDYVFIEFGHNDEKLNKPGVGTTLEAYEANLRKFILEARSKKAIPVLLTPIARRSFVNGHYVDSHKGYPDVVRRLSSEMHVPLIDLGQKTGLLLESLGEQASKTLYNYVDPGDKNYPNGKQDDTHLCPYGALKVASLACEGIRALNLPLAHYLK